MLFIGTITGSPHVMGITSIEHLLTSIYEAYTQRWPSRHPFQAHGGRVSDEVTQYTTIIWLRASRFVDEAAVKIQAWCWWLYRKSKALGFMLVPLEVRVMLHERFTQFQVFLQSLIFDKVELED
jgi:hypothetical protein